MLALLKLPTVATATCLTLAAFVQILGEGNARYVAKDYTGAGDIFTFLTTLTTPCLSGSAGPRNCNDTFAQVWSARTLVLRFATSMAPAMSGGESSNALCRQGQVYSRCSRVSHSMVSFAKSVTLS